MTTVWTALARALSPVEDRPRVASELESARYTSRSGVEYVVVHNPARRAYARLDAREFDLLPLMDGQHSVKELVVEYFRRHGVLALARVSALVHLLHEQGLLEKPATDAYAVLRRRLGGFAGSERFVMPGVRLGGVDAWLGRAYRTWGCAFFTPAWLWLGILLGVLGPWLVLLELGRGRYALYEFGGSVATMVVLALVALAAHELGHGLAVKHAGRHVYEAGVRLYFGLPAAYVDTSDIWMAPPRYRLLTAFAGPWTGLVLGGLCAVAALLVPTSAVGAVLFTAAVVFLVDNLFNFNPLLELDGYYMLIDFLDRPLLRPRALAFVRGPLWQRLWSRQRLSRDEWLLAAFGIGAIAYGVLAIGLALRAWDALLLPLVASSWQSGEVALQVAAVLLIAAVCVPLLLAAAGFARQMAGPANGWLQHLRGAAAERRHAEALATLRSVPILSSLAHARLLEVARALRAEDVAAGTEVVRQGDVGDRFYVIAGGAFEVLVDGVPVVRLQRGEYFGERALLHRAPRAATVMATEAGRVFALDASAFNALLASDLAARARMQSTLAFRAEVADMPLFRDLGPAELDLLLSRFTPVDVGAGTEVVREGEPGDRFFVIRSGRVAITREGQPLAELGPGDAFGEIALLLDVPRTASVTAVQPTRLLALEAHDFHDLLASYLGRAAELARLSHLRLRSHRRLDEVV